MTQPLLGLGHRVAGGLKALRPAFLTPLTPAQEANLGRENRFVYDLMYVRKVMSRELVRGSGSGSSWRWWRWWRWCFPLGGAA